MEFLISDTFTDSLSRLTGDEQKTVKTTAFDLQLNPANPGMSFHKLDKSKDKNFWSVRVSGDIRLIIHKTQGSLLLCYVGGTKKRCRESFLAAVSVATYLSDTSVPLQYQGQRLALISRRGIA